MTIDRRHLLSAMGAAALLPSAIPAWAQAPAPQTVADTAELYAGEKALYEAALKEGMVISNNTGPTWANWAALFRVFGQR